MLGKKKNKQEEVEETRDEVTSFWDEEYGTSSSGEHAERPSDIKHKKKIILACCGTGLLVAVVLIMFTRFALVGNKAFTSIGFISGVESIGKEMESDITKETLPSSGDIIKASKETVVPDGTYIVNSYKAFEYEGGSFNFPAGKYTVSVDSDVTLCELMVYTVDGKLKKSYRMGSIPGSTEVEIKLIDGESIKVSTGAVIRAVVED